MDKFYVVCLVPVPHLTQDTHGKSDHSKEIISYPSIVYYFLYMTKE